jgi:hypothetical protein
MYKSIKGFKKKKMLANGNICSLPNKLELVWQMARSAASGNASAYGHDEGS